MLNKYTFNTYVRTVTHKVTGRVYLIQNLDLNSRRFNCWANVVAYDTAKGTIETSGSCVFAEGDVSWDDTFLDAFTAAKLFTQYRESIKKSLMEGDLVVQRKGFRTSVVSAPKSATRHGNLTCPCHSVPMRIAKAPNGGMFYACGSKGETGCRVNFSIQRSTWSDPDGMVTGLNGKREE